MSTVLGYLGTWVLVLLYCIIYILISVTTLLISVVLFSKGAHAIQEDWLCNAMAFIAQGMDCFLSIHFYTEYLATPKAGTGANLKTQNVICVDAKMATIQFFLPVSRFAC